MTAISKTAALTEAALIRDETGTGLNTAARVGGTFEDFADSLLYSSTVASAADRTITVDDIETSALAGLIIHNSTPATDGAPQYSGALVLQGEGKITPAGARREVYARMQAQAVNDTSVTPVWMLALDQAAEGTAPDAASTTPVLTVTPTLTSLLGSGHSLVVPGYVSAGAGSVFGTFRVGNLNSGGENAVWFSNAAHNDAVRGLAVDASNNLIVGSTGTIGAGAPGNVTFDVGTSGTGFTFRIGGAAEVTFSATTADFQNNNVVTTGNLALGNGSQVTFDSSPGGTPVVALRADSSENLYVGNSGTNGSTGNIYDVKTGGSHSLRVNNVTMALVALNALKLQDGTDANFAIQGNAEAMIGLNIAGSGVRNLELFGDGSGGMGGMNGGIRVVEAVVVPSTAPTGDAVFLWGQDGAFYGMGSSGTIRTVVAAEPHCKNCGRDFAFECRNPAMGKLAVCMWCVTEELDRLGGDSSKYIITREAA